ncbi:hypothetical protein [Calothrix sp. PCC 7507]|uniref:hypothetical protein n=1 Tax=Calothrix sp. PCC 7507 TaxID=99598 RepID=UPI00029F42F0|nr:hypothetical protein [Calothrix sp. PCC 7507]AFY31337.1 hypothetical protein Cal7507_0853 [Calothrix sp. PCC 7507]
MLITKQVLYHGCYTVTRKGGNPNIKDHGFTTDRDEPLSERLNIRITKTTNEQLKELGDEKAEFCRNAINKALDERNSKGK